MLKSLERASCIQQLGALRHSPVSAAVSYKTAKPVRVPIRDRAQNKMAKDKPKPGKRAGKTPAGQPAAPPGMDSRFSAMLTDPRFQRFPKKRQQVAIDERFAGKAAGTMLACVVRAQSKAGAALDGSHAEHHAAARGRHV